MKTDEVISIMVLDYENRILLINGKRIESEETKNE